MNLLKQKIHRYLGEKYTLVFETPAPDGVEIADITGGDFTVGGVTLSVVNDLVDGVIVSGVPVPSSLALETGTYPFELSLTISGDIVVVAVGTMKLDKSLTLGAS